LSPFPFWRRVPGAARRSRPTAAPGGTRTVTYDFDGTAYAGSLLASATLMNNTAAATISESKPAI
jgi:hypothetical protein